MDDISSVLVFIDDHHKQCVRALQTIALLADTGSKEYKERFEGTIAGDNGWRVAETMREIANDLVGNISLPATTTRPADEPACDACGGIGTVWPQDHYSLYPVRCDKCNGAG